MSAAAAPLAGQRVVLTRAAHQSAELAAALRAAGAEIAHLPLLAVLPADPEPLRQAAANLDRYGWLAFTSANAADAFVPLLPPEARVPAIAAVGAATAAALRRHGQLPRLLAAGTAADLATRLAPLAAGQRVLVPQAADARPDLVAGLRAAGVAVDAVTAYVKGLPRQAPRLAQELFAERPLGWVTFTSPSVVRHFLALLAMARPDETGWPRRGELRAASIGPVTSAELRRWQLEPAAEAAEPSTAGLVAAIVAASLSGE